jgi:endonuclease G
MRRFVLTAVLLGIFNPFLIFQAHAYIDATLQMQLGNPSGAGVDTNNHDHYLIQRTVEAIDYSDNLGEPVWASWDLTAGDIGSSGRSSSFYTDTNLPPDFYWVTDGDYNGVGNINFNRGHMCPSEDRTDTTADNLLVFYLSNIVPQSSANNQGPWATLESYCQSLAQSGDEILIVAGPSGFGTNRIPSGKAVIADYTWKVAVVVPPGGGTALSRITSSTRVIAIKIPNNSSVSGSWTNFVTSASQIEADTGFTFFTALPTDVAFALRSEVDGQTNTNPVPVIFSFLPANGAAGTNVVITGTNFSSATSVTFNGASAGFTIDSGTQITVIAPANVSSGFINVTTAGGTAASSTAFSVNASGGNGGSTNIYSGTLIGWDMSAVTGYGTSPFAPTTNAANLTCVGLARGSGVGTGGSAAAGGWGGVNFTNATAALAIAANKFATFSVTANSGYSVSFTSVSRFDYRRSGTGPASGVLQFQIGSGAFTDITNLNYSSSSSSGSSIGAIDLSGFAALQNVGAGTNVTFRIVNDLGTGSSGTWYIYNVANSIAPDLALTGTVTPVVNLTPLQAWRQFWFGTSSNTGVAADTYVGTSDGMANLLKYALGLNPLIATNNPVTGDISSGYLRLTTARNPNATDVSLSGLVSGDLLTWTTNGVVTDQNSTVFQVHDSTPVTGGTNRFLRLRVTSP